ncbi:MAG: hypothetical protein PHV30_03185 [Candidatus Margulisbacteria bacterium]|nr:hypothetical protein [Candidatus Margulisiibacteriota bacterium]
MFRSSRFLPASFLLQTFRNVFLTICLSILSGACFAYPFPHYETWNVYETEHFNIYFNDKTRYVADQAFDIVEDIYKSVSTELKYSPRDKVELVFSDLSDLANGSADYFSQTIVIEVSSAPTNELGPFKKSALYNIITHELTHIIHLGMNYSSEALYRLTKRLTSKGFLYPQYIAEGYAVYNEKLLAGGGRLYNSYFHEYMMAFAKYHDFPKLSQLANRSMLRWPQGNGPYIVGAEFIDYLADQYGIQRLLDSYHDFAKDFYLSGFEQAIHQAYDKSAEVLYDEFLEKTFNTYMEKEKTETSYNIVISANGYAQYPAWLTENKFVYYQSDLQQDPGFFEYDLQNSKSSTMLREPYLMSNFQLSDESLYLIKYEYQDLYKTQLQLYRYSLTNNREEVLEKHVRNFIVKNNRLFMVQDMVTGDVLSEVNFESLEHNKLLEAEYLDFLAYDSLHYRLAYVKRNQAKNGLYFLDLKSKQENLLYEGNIRDLSFDTTGDVLYFVADWDGYSQLYSYQTREGSLHRLTNLLTGVYHPSVQANRLLFSTLTNKGYDICYIDNLANSIVSVNYKIPKPDEIVPTIPTFQAISLNIKKEITPNFYATYFKKQYPKQPKPYDMFNVNLLYFIPFLAISNYGSYVGFNSLMTDPLQYHQFQMYYLYNYGFENYQFQYMNTALYPFLQMNASKENDTQAFTTSLLFPFMQKDIYFDFSAGLQNQTTSPNNQAQYFTFAHNIRSYRGYNYSISPEKGFANLFFFKIRDNTSYTSVLDDLNLYIPGLALNHVLKLNITAGRSQNESFTVGGFPNTYFVRGYGYNDTKSGPYLAKFSLEYKYPLARIDDLTFFNFYTYQLYGTFFVDFADTDSRTNLFQTPLFSVGYLIDAQNVFSNLIPLDIGIGVATTPKSSFNLIFFFSL